MSARRPRALLAACCVAAGVATLAGCSAESMSSSSSASATASPPATTTPSRPPHRHRRPRARPQPRPPRHAALPISGADNDVVQPQPPPGSCHAQGSGLFSLPDPRCTPGAISPAVTQATIGTTICREGYTETVRPPEPGATPNPKDDLEQRLREMVCAGELSLASAQLEIASDWVALYRRLVS